MYKKLLTIFLFIFFFLFYPKVAFASTLYLSPASAGIPIGGVKSVQVRLNTGGEAINGVSAYLAYPADKIEVAWISYGGSFAIAAEGSYGGGGIKISRGNINGVAGNVNVATIGFRGKTAGSATVSFIGGSAAPRASDSSDSLSGSSGGTYNVAQGVAGDPVQQKSKTGQGGQALTPAPKDTSLPIISDVKILSVSTSSAEISWKTNENTDSVIEYGLEKDKYFLSSTNTKLATDHSLKIESPVLTPGVKIHFRVLSKDPSGNISVGDDFEVQILGYSVNITVVDKKNNPLQNAEVLLYSDPQKTITDANGLASFKNITPGKHLVVIKYKGTQATQEVDVEDNLTVQNFTVNVQVLGTNPLIFIVLILIAAGAVIFIKKKRIQIFKQKQNSSQNNQPPQNQTQ